MQRSCLSWPNPLGLYTTHTTEDADSADDDDDHHDHDLNMVNYTIVPGGWAILYLM